MLAQIIRQSVQNEMLEAGTRNPHLFILKPSITSIGNKMRDLGDECQSIM